MTEKQARKEIEERNKIQESIKMVDTLRKEQELREAAKEARQKKMSLVVSNISSVNTHKTEESEILLGNKRNISNEELEAAKIERNNLRNQRKKEIERDRRIEVKNIFNLGCGYQKGKTYERFRQRHFREDCLRTSTTFL